MGVKFACEGYYQCMKLPNQVPDEHAADWQAGFDLFQKKLQLCRDAASFMTKTLIDEGLSEAEIGQRPFTCPLALQRDGFVEKIKETIEVQDA